MEVMQRPSPTVAAQLPDLTQPHVEIGLQSKAFLTAQPLLTVDPTGDSVEITCKGEAFKDLPFIIGACAKLPGPGGAPAPLPPNDVAPPVRRKVVALGAGQSMAEINELCAKGWYPTSQPRDTYRNHVWLKLPKPGKQTATYRLVRLIILDDVNKALQDGFKLDKGIDPPALDYAGALAWFVKSEVAKPPRPLIVPAAMPYPG